MYKLIAITACVLMLTSGVIAKKNAPWEGNYEDLPLITSAEVVGAGFNARTGQSGLMQLLTWTYAYNRPGRVPLAQCTKCRMC